MYSNTEAAHKLLDLLITKAAVSGKIYKSTLRIPYLELKQSINASDYQYEDVNLQISIRLKWVPARTLEPSNG